MKKSPVIKLAKDISDGARYARCGCGSAIMQMRPEPSAVKNWAIKHVHEIHNGNLEGTTFKIRGES